MTIERILETAADICRRHHVKELILFGSRAKGNARERSDIDLAVSGLADITELVEEIEEIPTLYSFDIVNMDTCGNELLLEDIRQYGRKIL